jgi:drug/metabolite transporter (DMT)-like permease
VPDESNGLTADAAHRQGEAAPAPTAGTSHIGKALAWMGLALVSFLLVAVSGREAGRTIPTFELVSWRSIVSLSVLLCVMIITGQPVASLRTRRPFFHILRNCIHFCGQSAWLYALTLIPLTQLFALEFTAPLWVALLAPLLIGEAWTKSRIVAALIGFGGAVVVVQPGVVAFSAGIAFAAGSAVFFGLSMICTKTLTRTDPAHTIVFYMMLIQAVVGFLLGGGLQWPDWMELFWIVLLGVSGFGAHFGLARAIGYADAMVVAPMDFLRLPLVVVVGVFIYGEPLEVAVLIGAGIVVFANLINIIGERRAQRRVAA